MLQRRNIKLDRANKSILLRALGNVYYAQKATGGCLRLEEAEYLLARNALNQLRTRRIAEGGYTDAVDDALCRFL